MALTNPCPGWADLHRGPRHRAFTLVELVAAVTTVVLCGGAVVTSIQEVEDDRRGTSCLANLRGIARASHTFAASDRQELALPVHARMGDTPGALGEYEWGGKSGIGEPLEAGDPKRSKWGTSAGRGPATRGLNRIVYKGGFVDYANEPGPEASNWLNDTRLDLALFRCPGDDGYAGHHYRAWQRSGLSSFDHYGNSYTAGALWIGSPGNECRIESVSPFLKPISRVPNPANTVYFMENCGKFAWRKDRDTDACTERSQELGPDKDVVIGGWHNQPGVFHTAYVDGHSEPVTMKGHVSPQPRLSQYPARDDQPGTHETWKCAIVRAAGWQLDTLPAPPIKTSIRCTVAGGLILDVH